MKNPDPAGDVAPSGPDQRARATPIVPDRAEAERFLTALDPNATEFTFQTFDDNAERKKERKAKGKKDSFAKVFNGTLAQHWDALVKLNAKGAGIYVTLNETDFKGRTAKNIVRIRAFFCRSRRRTTRAGGRSQHADTATALHYGDFAQALASLLARDRCDRSRCQDHVRTIWRGAKGNRRALRR